MSQKRQNFQKIRPFQTLKKHFEGKYAQRLVGSQVFVKGRKGERKGGKK